MIFTRKSNGIAKNGRVCRKCRLFFLYAIIKMAIIKMKGVLIPSTA